MPPAPAQVPVAFTQAFEGLFRTLGTAPRPELKRQLREAGVDLERPLQSAYPAATFARCIELVAAELSPGAPRERAHWIAGERFLEGFAQTLMGRAMFGLLRVLGPRRTLLRMERNFRTGNNYLRMRTEELGVGRIRLHVEDHVEEPEYLAGILCFGGQEVGARNLAVTIPERAPGRCTLEVSWDEA